MDVGEHEMVVSAPGFETKTKRLTVNDKEGALVVMELVPVRVAPPEVTPDGTPKQPAETVASKQPPKEMARTPTKNPTTPIRNQPPGTSASGWAGWSADAPAPALAPFDAAAAKRHQQEWADYLGLPIEKEINLPGGVKLALMLIPPGQFLMGSTAEERAKFLEEAQADNDPYIVNCIPAESPQHRVRITRPFYLGKYEVTQAQWQAVMGNNPSLYKDSPTHPVEYVSLDNTHLFNAKLKENSSEKKLIFALPTESQWEYACRAGMTTAYSFGESAEDLGEHGWFKGNAGGKTQAVGRRKPNPFGLYDMHGNLWEWCEDWYAEEYDSQAPENDPTGPPEGKYRVYRGGGAGDPALGIRSAFRIPYDPNARHGGLGFRLVLEVDETLRQSLE